MKKLVRTLLSKPINPWSFSVVALCLVAMLGFSTYFWSQPLATNAFTATSNQIFKSHEYYRLFTALAVHADTRHFMSNSLFFFVFGLLLNSYFGWLWFPGLSILAGAIGNALTLALYPPEVALLGASGMVYFMAGAWATLYVFVDRRSGLMKRLMAALGVSLILFFPSTYEPEVSYLAHAIGFFMGVATAIIYFPFAKRRIRAEEVWKMDWSEWTIRRVEREDEIAEPLF